MKSVVESTRFYLLALGNALTAVINSAYRCWLPACLCILTFLPQLGWAEVEPQASLLEVERRIQQGDFKGASELASAGLKVHPGEAELWNLLGIAEGELGKYQASEDAFQRGLRVAPRSATLEENLGLIFFKQSKYLATKEHLTRAVGLGSQKPGVRFSLAASRLRTGEAAQGLADLKSLEGALGGLSEYWEERGFAELKADPKGAASSFRRALDIQPESLRALNGAASAAEQQGSDEEALAYLIRAKNKAPEDVPTLMHFGVVCLRRDLGPDALTALNKAHTLQPENKSALYLLARANVAFQNWDGALELFQDFARKAPQYPVTYYAMGWLEIKTGRSGDARRDLEHCLRLAPDLADARYELGQLDVDDNRLEAAEREFATILQQYPSHVKANVAMADLDLRRGKLNDAQAHLERALAEDPNFGPAHYKLSQVLQRKHETERAQEEMAIAERLNERAKQQSKVQLRIAIPEQLGSE